MNTITFPLLNLELNINKIAFTICGIPIYWYAILMVSSIIIGIILSKIQDGKFGIKFEAILDLCIIMIPIAFASARLYYVIFNLKAFPTFWSIFNLRDGGIAIYGGIIGGTITAYIFCKKKNINLLDLLDYIVPYLALGQCIGRWGNFINVEAYGSQTTLPWKMGIETTRGIQYVHPTFLYESISTLIIFIILMKTSKNRKYSGQITCLYLIMYSFARFFIEGLRTDSLMIGDLRISQVLSAIIFVITSAILTTNKHKVDKSQNK